ncbi:hypothetical protein PHYBOEH_000977 [Phytophthora boehmeriae]|uniref:RxLR effector protein n=1 Tax=Phytophthora boehmeriae TaxID=109152 RepID=A0A8T1V8A2_9STRA|nr:hypothetical protein PHYBOEH_000977 [Phytophthora boehmeriae]
MRLTNYLLVAAAAFLVSVSSAADSTSALSAMASPDAVQSIGAADGDKRFLRTTKTQTYDDDDVDDDDDADGDDDDDDDDDLDSEDEKRMFRLNRGDDDLLKLIKKFPGADEQINTWRTADKTVRQLKNELEQTPQMVKLINLYAAVLARNNHVVRRWD